MKAGSIATARLLELSSTAGRARRAARTLACAGLCLASSSAAFASGLPGPQFCTTSGYTLITLTTRTGDRVVIGLQRAGDALTGMAYLHLKDGRIPARGPVSGRFGGHPQPLGRRAFELQGTWNPPADGGLHAWGVLGRGAGTGEVATGFAAASVTIHTADRCAHWPQEYYVDSTGKPGTLPAPRHLCIPGHVWRVANPWDRVCVTPQARDLAARENGDAPKFTDWARGGQVSCRLGYLHRNAFPGDTVCTTLEAAMRVARENEEGAAYSVNAADGQADATQLPYCRAYADEAVHDAARHREQQCAGDGPRWNPAAHSHLEWCMASMLDAGTAATRTLAQRESDARKNAVLRCELDRAGNHAGYTDQTPLIRLPPEARVTAAVTERGGLAEANPSRTSAPLATHAEDAGVAGARLPPQCRPGFVHRNARPTDYVCVTPAAKRQAEIDNALGLLRWVPESESSPRPCQLGYVWREAVKGDDVCVLPARRAEVREENRRAAGNRLPSAQSRPASSAIDRSKAVATMPP